MKALKKVPGKNKGLSKLPTSVRNKMGYMKKGGKVYQDGGKAPKGERDLGGGSSVGLTLSEAERRADKEMKYSKNTKQYGTSKFNRNTDRQRVARLKAEQGVDLAGGEKGKKLRQLERQDPAAYNRVKESARQAAESEERTRQIKRNMKSGGKVVKYQNSGKFDPTPTERTYTGDDRRQITSSGNQPGADYKGYNKTKTPKEVLEGSEMRRLKAALQKNKYGTNGMSLADMRKVAKTKGLYDDARKLARQDYLKEMDKRKG